MAFFGAFYACLLFRQAMAVAILGPFVSTVCSQGSTHQTTVVGKADQEAIRAFRASFGNDKLGRGDAYTARRRGGGGIGQCGMGKNRWT